MKLITNNKTADGYRFSAGRQSKKIVVDVTRAGWKWSMTLPNGIHVVRESIKLLKRDFGRYVDMNYSLPTTPKKNDVAIVTPTVKRSRTCPTHDCGNPRYFKFDTCISCHYSEGQQ